MDARMIITLSMGACLLVWVLFCGIGFVLRDRRNVAQSGFTAHVKCECCGTVYDVSSAEFAHSLVVKSKRISRTQMKGPAIVAKHSILYYAKRFNCPTCGKRHYAQVLNLDEIQEKTHKTLVKTGMQGIAAMVIGGILIITLFQIPIHFANKEAQRRVEEMKQQQYEQFKQDYGLGND